LVRHGSALLMSVCDVSMFKPEPPDPLDP
jgi:hypothetical protein